MEVLSGQNLCDRVMLRSLALALRAEAQSCSLLGEQRCLGRTLVSRRPLPGGFPPLSASSGPRPPFPNSVHDLQPSHQHPHRREDSASPWAVWVPARGRHLTAFVFTAPSRVGTHPSGEWVTGARSHLTCSISLNLREHELG